MKVLILLVALCLGLSGPGGVRAQTNFKSLNYLYSIAGRQTVAGIHNREPNSAPATSTNRIYNTTGKYPALWSGDFLFAAPDVASRQTMIDEAKAQWASGALVNIMFHACPPTQPEPCAWEGGVKSTLNDAQWNELMTNGTPLNNNWKARLDVIAGYLQDLKNSGVEVYFRPLHEMNQGVFWWAGRPGANGTRKLFQLTHDYLAYTKGLTNLIWVWDLQDFNTLPSDLANYNPGSGYWDVLALDMYYSDGTGYTAAKYNAVVNTAGGKPIAIGECEVLPSPALLAAQPKWGFFMGWSELVFNSNSTVDIQAAYWAGNVITRDEMPGWNAAPNPAPNLAYHRPVVTSSVENSTNTGAKAVDADGNTRWSSTYANNQYIYVDLGQNYSLSRVRLAWEAAYARDYQVQVSTDNVTWTTIKEVWGKSSAAADNHTGLNAPARYVKIYCINRATQYGFSLFELEVYGAATGVRLATASNPAESAPGPKFTAFPNPASDQITVVLAPGGPPAGWLLLTDGLGRLIARQPATPAASTFSLAHQRPGVYTVTLVNTAGRFAQKVVKQ